MPLDLSQTLRNVFRELESEKDRIDRQLTAVRQAIAQVSGSNPRTATAGRRRRMSAEARRAVSRRMKAYWSKRRAQATRASKASQRKRK
jgi:hypothetical protein